MASSLRTHDFRRLRKIGTRLTGKCIAVEYHLSGRSRLGITISKKWGKAHIRNRFKRIVREGYRKSFSHVENLDINISPRYSFLEAKSHDIAKELETLFKPLSTRSGSDD